MRHWMRPHAKDTIRDNIPGYSSWSARKLIIALKQCTAKISKNKRQNIFFHSLRYFTRCIMQPTELYAVEARYDAIDQMLAADRKMANTMDLRIESWVDRQEYPTVFVLHFFTVGIHRTTDFGRVPLWKLQAMINRINHRSKEEEQRFIDDVSETIEFARDWNHQLQVLRRWDEEVWTDEEDGDSKEDDYGSDSVSTSTVPSLSARSSTTSISSSSVSSDGSNQRKKKQKKRKKTIHPMFKKKKIQNNVLKHWPKLPRSNVQRSPPPFDLSHVWK